MPAAPAAPTAFEEIPEVLALLPARARAAAILALVTSRRALLRASRTACAACSDASPTADAPPLAAPVTVLAVARVFKFMGSSFDRLTSPFGVRVPERDCAKRPGRPPSS